MMKVETKAEKRERIKRNRSKMAVTGTSVKTILRINIEKAAKARGEKI